MRSRTLAAFALLALFVTACQPKSDETMSSQVDLASLPEDAQLGDSEPLEASFMSADQSFTYTVHYDGSLLQIVDGQFEGASVLEPSFTVMGGAQIVIKSMPSTELRDLEVEAGEPKQVGGQLVYHLSKMEDSCGVDTSIVPVSVESLVLTLRICDGQDAQNGQKALYALLKRLEVKAL